MGRPTAELDASLALGLALLFGALSTLAHGPIHAWWFAPWCIGGWFLLIRTRRHWLNASLGFAYGVGWFTAGLWWVGTGMFTLTSAGAAGAVGLTLLLVMYLSCFPAIAGMLLGVVLSGTNPLLRWFLAAAGWTLIAWLRATLFGGFPWMSVGTGQLTGPLSAWAPVGGCLLVEFTAILVAAALADLIAAITHSAWNSRPVTRPVLLIGGLMLVSMLVRVIEWTHPAGELTVRLVQGNLPQREKFSAEGLRRASEVYGAAIANSEARLTILPETAFPMTWQSLPAEFRRNIRRFGSERQTTIMLGSLVQERSGSLTNDLLLIRPTGTLAIEGEAGFDDLYVKRHLLLVGEYLPQSLTWLGRHLNIAYSSLTPGAGATHALAVDAARIAPTICFESQFGSDNAMHARDANLFVNISNLSWFAGTWAIDEDLDVIRTRSLEAGRWTARVANSGITAIVDERGAVVDELPQDVSETLDGRVQLRTGLTPYDGAGDTPIIAICTAALLAWAIRAIRPWFVRG